MHHSKNSEGETAAPGNKGERVEVTLLPNGSLSHPHTRAQQRPQPPLHPHSVPTETTLARGKSSPSEIYGKIDGSVMEGKSTLSALSIYLPAHEWWVIKIYWKFEKKSHIF